MAVQTGVPKLVEKVLVLKQTSNGELLQFTSEGDNPLTPLEWAVENDNIDIVKVIKAKTSHSDYSNNPKYLPRLVKMALTSAPPKIDIAVELFSMIRFGDQSNAVDPAKQMSENKKTTLQTLRSLFTWNTDKSKGVAPANEMSENKEPMAFQILHQLFILEKSIKHNIKTNPGIIRDIIKNHIKISDEEIKFLRQLDNQNALPQKDRGPLKVFLTEYDQRHQWLEK